MKIRVIYGIPCVLNIADDQKYALIHLIKI